MMQTSRVLVAGSSQLAEELVPFAEELGRKLMAETHFTLVTGGLESRGRACGPALDGIVAKAALKALDPAGREAQSRIVTTLPSHDPAGFERFEIGQVVRLPHAGPRMRRDAMVLTCDAVVIIGGARGTKEIADLAYVAGKPMIVFPFTGGAARECWDRYAGDLAKRLSLRDAEILSLREPREESEALQVCVDVLVRVLRPRCFVAMPFGEHPQANVLGTIRSVAEEAGYEVVRVDQENFTGNIVDAIWDGIRNSSVVVADLTTNNPNVFYELGISQAIGKPTLLIVHDRRGEVPADIPFDVGSQRILAYAEAASLKLLLRRQLPPASGFSTRAAAPAWHALR